MRFHAWIAAAIAVFTSAALVAAPANFDYQYLDVNLHSNQLDESNGSGFSLEVTRAFSDNFFVIGRLSNDRNELIAVETLHDIFAPGDELTFRDELELDDRKLAVGIGGAWPINHAIDFTAQVLYVKAELEVGYGGRYHYSDGAGYTESGSYCDVDPTFCGSDTLDDSGLMLQVGFRAAATPTLELYGNIISHQFDVYSDFEDYIEFYYGDIYNVEFGNTLLELGGRYALNEHNAIKLGYLKHGDLASVQLGWRLTL